MPQSYVHFFFLTLTFFHVEYVLLLWHNVLKIPRINNVYLRESTKTQFKFF